ncbi:MAG: ankyrin repeat domain-containing protein [Chloroherpetonaceae bacterium]|nr:ankyrin repeat domain-containing protein [Chthonomonadaceae bacterium]MDW8209387.1 ankyrin repeat domain-containing protein [Chloroherpetonaceae bacterium]
MVQGRPGSRVLVRHQLADAAKEYNWKKVLDILYAHPDLINATRPGGEALYTPLHQAVHGNAPLEVIQRLLDMGASLTVTNIDDERPVDIAKRKGYYHLVPLLDPDRQQVVFPNEVAEAESVCALRFRGYEYEHWISTLGSRTTGSGLTALARFVVEELALHRSMNDNFAAFFELRRFLHKWENRYLTRYSREYIAYDFLFLHLYAHEPAEPFRDARYCYEWQEKFLPRAESIAAIVRKSFQRRGGEKKISVR